MSNPFLARRFGLDMVSDNDHADFGQVVIDASIGPYPLGAALGVGTSQALPSYMLSEYGEQLVFNKIIQNEVFAAVSLMPGRWTVKVGTQFQRAPRNFFWTGVDLHIDPPFDNPPGALELDVQGPDGQSFIAPVLRRNGDALTGGEMLAGIYNTLRFYNGAWRVVTVFNAEVGGTGRSAVSLNGTTVVPAANRIDFFGNFDVQPTDGGTTAVVTVAVAPGGGGPGGPADWNTLENKPSTFPPEAHDHDCNEGYFDAGNRTGTYALPPGHNTYRVRLVGPLVLTLPSDRPASASEWRAITVYVDQDGVGNRTCTFAPPTTPAGQQVFWSTGAQPPLALAANGRTRYVFTYLGGELRVDGVKTY